MRLDDNVSVDQEWFEGFTRKEQVDFLKRRTRYILTQAQALKLLKGVGFKKEKKKKDGL